MVFTISSFAYTPVELSDDMVVKKYAIQYTANNPRTQKGITLRVGPKNNELLEDMNYLKKHVAT